MASNKLTNAEIAEFYNYYTEVYYSLKTLSNFFDDDIVNFTPVNGSSIKAIEIGCGCGKVCVKLANPAASVTGVDISEKHIAICNEKRKIFNLTNVEYICVDAEKFIGKLSEYDYVIMVKTIHYFTFNEVVSNLKNVKNKGHVYIAGVSKKYINNFVLNYFFEIGMSFVNIKNTLKMFRKYGIGRMLKLYYDVFRQDNNKALRDFFNRYHFSGAIKSFREYKEIYETEFEGCIIERVHPRFFSMKWIKK